jgi:phosphonate metabolism protein (transferase hexapeptide repeat family)
MKQLSKKPTLHPTAIVETSLLGIWTEVSAHSYISDSILGDYSYVMEYNQIVNCSIGKFCSIASFVRLNPSNHPLKRPTSHHFTYRAAMFGLGDDDLEVFAWRKSQPVKVGHDVWIGHNATVMPGVSIGNGAAVGSSAVVTRDVEPYTIVAGVPARVIRSRFSDGIAEKLEAMKWWNWSHDTLRERLPDFRKSAEEFIEKYSVEHYE